MRFPLNLITLALLTASSSATAADFGVSKANTTSIDSVRYQCNKCVTETGYTGEISISSGYIVSDDVHAGNRFGTDKEGINASVNGDIKYQNAQGYRSSIQAHQLGLQNGFAHIESGKNGRYNLELDYQNIATYKNGDVQTGLWHNNGMLVPSDSQRLVDLNIERQRLGLGFKLRDSWYQAYLSYDHEDKSGHQSTSLVSPQPVNFALPIDASTDSIKAGFAFTGKTWLADLSYNGSQYKNDIDNLSLPYLYDIYSTSPDNQAHQLTLSGQYQLASTVMTARVVAGRMLQDDDLILASTNPIVNWDGQVDTLDAKFAVSSMVNSRLRFGASLDYSDRDNKSSVWDFYQGHTSLSFEPMSGTFEQNVPLDIERQTYKLNAAYRIASGYRLQAGYERKEIERSYGERESTHEDKLWSKLKVRPLTNIGFELGLAHEQRGGSHYEANRLTSTEEQTLLRKYHIADRDRTEANAKLNWQISDWLSLDLQSYYALDDYDQSTFGLLNSQDIGYDLYLNFTANEQLNAYAFAGQQWINSDMAAGNIQSNIVWEEELEDNFINLGAGISYSGLFDGRVSVGGDYLFANSNSDGHITANTATDLGDYYSYNHSVNVYASYSLSKQMGVKLAYQYERYYDTDPATVAVNDIPGLITLGELDHNYNAHQIMLSFSYLLH